MERERLAFYSKIYYTDFCEALNDFATINLSIKDLVTEVNLLNKIEIFKEALSVLENTSFLTLVDLLHCGDTTTFFTSVYDLEHKIDSSLVKNCNQNYEINAHSLYYSSD